MSHEIACLAPDPARLQLLETAAHVLGHKTQPCQALEDLPETPELVLCWDILPEDEDVRKKSILLAGQNYPVDIKEFFHVFEMPYRAGALVDVIRRFFGSGPAYNVPAEIPLGNAVFRPRESVFIPENAGNPLSLTEKERDILLALYQAGKDGLERSVLLDKVWAYVQGVETHTLETHIYRLRRKIEADPAAPTLLINDDGQYKLSYL